MYPSTSTQQPAAICALKSPADAIHILEAVRLGLVPRVTRRLTGHERSMIRPGTVWVWEEEETNMRRWTDGRRWGASRVGGGGFLVYTESSDNLSPPPSRGTGTDYMGRPHDAHAFTPYGRSALKPESLIKQTYSTTMTHPETGKAKKFHVVAYSSKHNPQGDANNPLPLPQQLPLLSTIKIAPGIWPEWEHRRDPDYSRRGTSYPPVPAGSAAVPVTATASPEGEQNFDQYRSKTPSREAFTARASPSHLQQQQRYPQSYAPQVMNTGYPNRPIAHPSYPPQDQRYHPYHDPNRNRPFAPPQNGQPPSAPSSVPAIPNPNQPPQEMYFDEPRLSQQPPRMSPNMYAPQFDQYGRPYRRDQYFEEFPPPGQYYDPNAQPGQRSPEDKLRDAQYSHERHHSAPTHLAPPTVEMTAPNTGGRKSPKMSIDASLLNPPNGMPPQQQQQTTSAPPSNGTTGGLTLPPLRLAIDERTKQNNGAPPGNSPSGYGKLSPRVVSDNVQNSNEPVKGEDARQLGELGKRVSL